jgi:septal ring factor EnvC (AmiA/AmiB activator)
VKISPLSVSCVLAAGAAALLCGCNSDSQGLASAPTEITNLSNQLASARATLSEKESTIQTLETKDKLHQTDLSSASNRIASLTAELAGAKASGDRCASDLQARAAQLSAAQEENTRRKEEAARLTEAVQSLEHRLAFAQGQLDAARGQLALANQHLNESEASKAALIQHWSDPSALRAQLRDLQRTSPPHQTNHPVTASAPARVAKVADKHPAQASPPKPPEETRVELQPDGTVKLVPVSLQH